MHYGKGAGCSFLQDACSKGPIPGRHECCTAVSNAACDFYNKKMGTCIVDSFSDNTQIVYPYTNGNCEDSVNSPVGINYKGQTYQKGSRCIIGSIILKPYQWQSPSLFSYCQRAECKEGKVIIYLSKGDQIVCNYAGEKAVPPSTGNYSGEIICPDPLHFCKIFYIT